MVGFFLFLQWDHPTLGREENADWWMTPHELRQTPLPRHASMKHTFEGDEWKNEQPEPIRLTIRTREQQQARIDMAYVEGRITLEQWRTSFAFVSGLDSTGRPIARA